MDDRTEKPCFDASRPDAFDVVRQVLLDRIGREQSYYNQFSPNYDCGGFLKHFTFAKPAHQQALPRFLLDAFWALVVEGVIAPGSEKGDPNTALFHVTEHGRRILAEPDYQPHDPVAYLQQLGATVSPPDPTVLAYLQESLHCYSRGLVVASTMMLGIAAERVFQLVCDSLVAALKDPGEQAAFQKILDRNPMKPKLDWVSDKLRQIQNPKRPPDLPEDMDIKIPGIFNLIRCQRNDVGHPRPSPPSVTRDDAYGYLRLFPSYYATAEKVREFLAKNKV